jgi:CDP-diglyceride synthetase
MNAQPVFQLLPISWQSLAAVATVLAVVVAGWWTWIAFIRSRQKYPKVNLSYSFEQYLVNGAWRLVRISLKIENQSNVLITPRTADTRLSQ